MSSRAELSIAKVPAEARARVLSAPKLATGMPLSKIQDLIQKVADQNAPHFRPGQEPLSDSGSFVATSGKSYYPPAFRVASREAPAVGPEVRFLKDADNKVRLLFELEECAPAPIAGSAEPFAIRISSLILKWNGGQRAFSQPTLMKCAPSQSAGGSGFCIRAGDAVSASEVELLSAALGNPQSGARIEIVYTYGYWVENSSGAPPRPPFTTPPATTPPFSRPPFSRPPWLVKPLPRPVPDAGVLILRPDSEIVRINELRRPIITPAAADRTASVFDKILANKERLKEAAEEASRRTGVASFKTRTVTRAVPFGFDPSLEQNRLIFAAIRSTDSVPEVWVDTSFGPIRRAPYPNTIYSLPNEVRLAFNIDLGTAHVVPSLYRDEHDDVRVRVVLRAVPWFDPEKAQALRDHLYVSSAGSLASPQIIAGGYQQATLKLLTAFPEQIKVLSEAELAIDLSSGVDLTLDLSLEFYKFVAELLTGPIGLVGEVRVLLQETPAIEGGAPVRLERTIPVRLKLGNLANFPVEVEVEEEAIRPDRVTIRNSSSGGLRIGGCIPRLLQIDSNSVIPLEVFDGETDAGFPRELEPNQSLTVNVKPHASSESLLWNAVEVNLTRMALTQTPAQSLERIHELAPSGSLSWKLLIECPPFLRNPIPEQLANLFHIEIQISRAGFATQQVVLSRDKATAELTMQRTLKDLLAVAGSSEFSFQYRVRNVYYDHLGKWGATQSCEGSTCFVFPNSIDSD